MANCPICNNQIPNNQTVCPYCETIVNKERKIKTKSDKLICRHKIYLIVATVVMVIATIVAVFLYNIASDYGLCLITLIPVGLFNVVYEFKSGIVKALIAGVFHFITISLGYLYALELSFCGVVISVTVYIIINIINIRFTMFLMDKNIKQPVSRKISKSEKENIETLKQYKELYDNGVITEQEFTAKKKQLLGL